MNRNKILHLLPLVLLLVGCTSRPVDDGASKFEGEWKAVELSINGKSAEAAIVERTLVIFGKDGQLQMVEVKEGVGKTEIGTPKASTRPSTFQVDATKTPAEIDLVVTEGENAGKSKPGIYVFEDTRLKICYAELGDPRPADFVAAPKTTLIVLERKPQ